MIESENPWFSRNTGQLQKTLMIPNAKPSFRLGNLTGEMVGAQTRPKSGPVVLTQTF